MRAPIRCILTGALLASLTACTNIKNDGQRTRTEGALTGAAIGAALGAGAGALLKKDKKGALVGAAAGALLGGLAGAAAGDSVAKKKEGYTAQENATDRRLTRINRQVADRKKYNARLRKIVAQNEQELTAVLASDRSDGPTVQEFELRTSLYTELGRIDRTARSWQETIDAHKVVLGSATADGREPELQTEIDRLTQERAELLRQRERLTSINDKLAL